MTIRICDICKLKDNKTVSSAYRIGYTNGIKIDVCQEHKNWPRQFKGNLALTQAYSDLLKTATL